MSAIADNLRRMRTAIDSHARACGRDPASITLVAVSKTKPTEAIREAYAAGQMAFGENYAQEFRDKSIEIFDLPIQWHFIGHLQSNKAKYVAGKSVLIHTLGKESLVAALDRLAARQGIVQDCLIEINLSGELAKSGCAPDEMIVLLKAASHYENIRVVGLMTIGSLTEDREKTRAEFSRLRKLRDEANASEVSPYPLTELSMGMSGDWQIAIEEGATIIRIGTAIFGER
jgi:pyridoxal phosphate enzyme (YggS family)